MVDYDASLVSIANAQRIGTDAIADGYAYENAAGDSKNYFPQNLNDETPVLLEKGDCSIRVALKEEETLSDVSVLEETIQDIYDNKKAVPTIAEYRADDNSFKLQYESGTNGIKENLILYEKPDNNIWKFELQLHGMIPQKDQYSESITFYDKESGEIVGGIQMPNMNDATQTAYSEEITYDIVSAENEIQTEDQRQNIQTIDQKKELEESNTDTYILTMTVDREYLDDKSRIYPVIIDPTITWRESAMIDDVNVKSGEKENTNFYTTNNTSISAGASKAGVCRSYLHFKNLQEKLRDYTIASAKLILYEGESVAGKNIKIFRVNEPWNRSKITWKNRSTYDSGALSSCVTTGVKGTQNKFTITDYVRNVIKGIKPDYGIVVRATDEKDGKLVKYYGSRSSKTTYHPKLSIVYYDKPSKASSVSLSKKYIKPGKSIVVNWEGICTPILSNIQYRIAEYDISTKKVGKNIISYSNDTYIGTTSSGTKTVSQSKKLPEGEYRIYVRGVDKYKNVGAGSGAAFIIDGTAPTLKSVSATITTSSKVYAKEIPSIKWSGAADRYFDKVQYKVGDSKYVTLGTTESGTKQLDASYFSESGKYTISVRTIDKSGNVSQEKNINYYYDGTNPELEFFITPGMHGNTNMPMLRWSVADTTLKKIQYSLDYGIYQDIGVETSGTYIIPVGQINREKSYTIK